MSRIVVVAGVHLDRAWPDLGRSFGDALRAWSREVLARVVEEARQREADTLVILGDLLDRSTVVPDTTDYAAAVLGTFPGDVLIAPGPMDWAGDDGPYDLGTWRANVHFWTNAGLAPAASQPDLWGSAWIAPSSWSSRTSATPDGREKTFFRAQLGDSDIAGRRPGDRVVTSGAPANDFVIAVEDVVHRPGECGGYILVLDADPTSVGERVAIAGQPGLLVDLDVTTLETPADFAAAAQDASQSGGPVLLRLSGTLSPRILLPESGGPEVASNVTLDADALTFAVEAPDSSDRSTRAEFLRAMALTRGDERERHQTTALGLEALSASGIGA